jgi:hypothetical protein
VNIFTPSIKTNEAAQKRVRQWVRALRSGKYEQGSAYLRHVRSAEPTFCCLGVFCDLQDPAAWFDDSQHPLGLQDQLSARGRLLLRLSVPGQKELVTLNDGNEDATPPVDAVDFKAIAKRIEHDLKERLAVA